MDGPDFDERSNLAVLRYEYEQWETNIANITLKTVF